MLIEGAFALLVLLAYRKVKGRKGMTKERRDIYLSALEHLVEPNALRELADGFEKDGLPVEADMLRKRADLREMCQKTPEKWENYRALCERAIRKPDADPQALEDMASGFEAMTASGTAHKLRKRAAERRMEILAHADMEQRKREESMALEAAEAAKAALPKDTDPPPTPNNSGVIEKKIEEVEKKIEKIPDPDKTVEPKAEATPSAP